MSEETKDETPPQESTLHSRWRPLGGWVCVLSIGYELVLFPLCTWILDLLAILYGQSVPVMPHVDKTLLLEMVAIFVGYRSFEKFNQVAAK